jgi:uncharacterized membrane protein YdcZ (DUF606 family)
MWRLIAVCGGILGLIFVASGLFAAGLAANQAIAFTLFGGCLAAMLGIALRLALQDRKHHEHDH